MDAKLTDSKVRKEEIWKEIKNYPEYEVSNLGRIKRLAGFFGYFNDLILKPIYTKRGYLVVGLWKNKKAKFFVIHKIILTTFIGPQPEGYDPHHINNVRDDNRLENLMWLPIKENRGRKGEKHHNNKLKEGEVWLIKKLLASKKIKQAFIGRMFKVTRNCIFSIKKGDNWSYI